MSTLETLLIGKTALLVINYWTKRMDTKDLLLLRSRGSVMPERKVNYPAIKQAAPVERKVIINIKGAS